MKNAQSTIRNPHSIELHIEELVLHGLSPGDRYRIADAVELELSRLLAEPGFLSSIIAGDEIVRVDGGTFAAARGAKPAAIGVQIAQAVYGGLSQYPTPGTGRRPVPTVRGGK